MTADALFTQMDIARTSCDAGGDYLMEVKGNQPTPPCRRAQEMRLYGGRIARRMGRTSTELTGYTDWPGLAQAVCIERRVTHKAMEETHTDVAYANAATAGMSTPPSPCSASLSERTHKPWASPAIATQSRVTATDFTGTPTCAVPRYNRNT